MRDCSAFNPEVRRWSWRKLRAWSDDLPRRDQLSRAVGGAVNDRAGGWQLWFSGRRASHGLRFFLMNQRAASSILKRSEEHTSELQSHSDLVCRLLLEKKKKKVNNNN